MCYIHISALIAESLKRRGECTLVAPVFTLQAFCSIVCVCMHMHKHPFTLGCEIAVGVCITADMVTSNQSQPSFISLC